MKKRVAALRPYAAVYAADFYLLPLLIRDTGAAMLLLLCAVPLIASITSVMYGARHGFSLLLPIMAIPILAARHPAQIGMKEC